MSLKDELLELEKRITIKENTSKKQAILLHAKAHLFHNKKIHSRALELFDKHNIEHIPFDELDESK